MEHHNHLEHLSSSDIRIETILDPEREPVKIEECLVLPLPKLNAPSNRLLSNAFDYLKELDNTEEGDEKEVKIFIFTENVSASIFQKMIDEQQEPPPYDNGIINGLANLKPEDFAWKHYIYDKATGHWPYVGDGEIDYDRYDRFLSLFDQFVEQYKKDVDYDSTVNNVSEVRLNGVTLPVKEGTKIISGVGTWGVMEAYEDSDEIEKATSSYILYLPGGDQTQEQFLKFAEKNMSNLWQVLDPKIYSADNNDVYIDIDRAKRMSAYAFYGDKERLEDESEYFYETNYPIVTRLACEMGALYELARLGSWAKNSVKSQELATAIEGHYHQRVKRVTDWFAGESFLNQLAATPSLNEDDNISPIGNFPGTNSYQYDEEWKDIDPKDKRLTLSTTEIVDFQSLFSSIGKTAKIIDSFEPENRESIYQFLDDVATKNYTGNEEQFEIDLMNTLTSPWRQYVEKDE